MLLHRQHLARILAAVRRATDPRAALREHLLPDTHPPTPTTLLAIGKAAEAMAAEFVEHRPVHRGAVVIPHAPTLSLPKELYRATAGHPIPTDDSFMAAFFIRTLFNPHLPKFPLTLLLSGGGSALVSLPPSLRPAYFKPGDIAALTAALLRAGAPIHDLNTVRKHIDAFKGGRLAAAFAPTADTPITAYILSDVIGDDVSTIASGPVSPDPTTFADTLAVLDHFNCADAAPAIAAYLRDGAAGLHAETPKPGDPIFNHVTTRIIASNTLAVDAAAREAAALGYTVHRLAPATGDAAATGIDLARRLLQLPPPAAIVIGGETTVRAASGFGGRNQHLALAAALALEGVPNASLFSFATDGVDGLAPPDAPPAAGAIVTGGTAPAARAAGLDPAAALAATDSFTFFDALDKHTNATPDTRAHLLTGPTGTNVCDITVALLS